MKIAFLHDRHYNTYLGGAELSTKYWYEKGIQQGYDITLFSCQNEVPLNYDFYLIGNHIDFQKKDCFKSIINTKKYGLVVHNSNPRSHLKEVFDKASLIVWIARDQYKEYNVNHKNVLCKPCYIDHKHFYNLGLKREDTEVYVGEIAPHKVTELMIKEISTNTQKKYHFYGSTKNYPQFVSYLDSYENVNIGLELSDKTKLNKVYNRYQTFFWKLNRYGSFGRTLVEAMLTGCNLNVNKQSFGLFKYDVDWGSRESIVEWLENGLETFWPDILDNVN